MENTTNPNNEPATCFGCSVELGGTVAEREADESTFFSEENGEMLCEDCNQIEADAFWAWERRQMDAARFG